MLNKIARHPSFQGIIRNGKNKTHLVDLLGEGVKINGTYTSDKNVRVVGTIDGNIQVEGALTIEKEGVIKGNAYAKDGIVVFGKVQGDLRSAGKVIVRNTATITGCLYTKTLEIEAEAVVEGEIHMSEPVGEELKAKTSKKRQAS